MAGGTFPQWMLDVLADMESGKDTAPMLEFETHSDAGSNRLKFYKLLAREAAAGREIVSRIVVKWESNDGSKAKRILRFVLEDSRAPKRLTGADKDEASKQLETERYLAELRSKYKGTN